VTLRANKPAERRRKVLFINAVNEVAREQAQSFLRERHQNKILAAYEAFACDDGFAAVANLDQIADKQYSLAIPLYVAGNGTADEDGQMSVTEALTAWRAAAGEAATAVDGVLALLRQEVAR
jgi:type I restriction enzyme M protein